VVCQNIRNQFDYKNFVYLIRLVNKHLDHNFQDIYTQTFSRIDINYKNIHKNLDKHLSFI